MQKNEKNVNSEVRRGGGAILIGELFTIKKYEGQT